MVVAEAVGVAVEVEDDGAVQEPVEHGDSDGRVAEDLAQDATPRLVVRMIEVFA